MYFFKYKELALALHQRKVTERDYSLYKIGFAVVILFELAVSVFFGGVPLGSALFANLLKFAIVWLIISFINRKGDNQDKLKRFLCFLMPAYLRTVVFVIAIVVIIGLLGVIVKTSFGVTTSDQWEKFTSIVSGLFSILYIGYCYIVGFNIASGQKTYSPGPKKSH